MVSRVLLCPHKLCIFDHLVNNENGRDFVIAIILDKQIFSYSVILAFTKTITCFEVVMFHVLTSCVSFCYVVNCEKRDFVIRDFIVPTNCVLLTNNHETSTDFHKSFVLTNYN